MPAGVVMLIGTCIFAALGIIGCVWATWSNQPGLDKSLMRLMATLTAFCCWLMWIVVFMSQINPLIAPEMGTS